MLITTFFKTLVGKVYDLQVKIFWQIVP